MPEKISYKGFEITPAPLALQSGGWTHEGYIIQHKDDSVLETKVLADGHSETLEKAVEVTITECKRIIDKRPPFVGAKSRLPVEKSRHLRQP